MPEGECQAPLVPGVCPPSVSVRGFSQASVRAVGPGDMVSVCGEIKGGFLLYRNKLKCNFEYLLGKDLFSKT